MFFHLFFISLRANFTNLFHNAHNVNIHRLLFLFLLVYRSIFITAFLINVNFFMSRSEIRSIIHIFARNYSFHYRKTLRIIIPIAIPTRTPNVMHNFT